MNKIFYKIQSGWTLLIGLILNSPLEAFPLKEDLQRYSQRWFKHDLKSGLNVALLAFPQGMAYAVIAGLPIVYGIISSAVAAIVAPFFSGSRYTILGPTNATAFMIFSCFAAFPTANPEAIMPMLVFLVGVMLVVAAYLRAADLIAYISRSVVVGYITGAAVLIMVNQMKHVLGVSQVLLATAEEGAQIGARTFFTVAMELSEKIPYTQWPPLLLSAITIAGYVFLQKKWKNFPAFAAVLVFVSVLHIVLKKFLGAEIFHVETFSALTFESFQPKIPHFPEGHVLDAVSQLFGVAFAIAFLAALENSVMAKTLSSRTGDQPRMHQDMLSVGISNLACSFFSAMPASGSLTRSALNFSSGAASRLSSLFSGLFVVAGIFLLGGFINYVPKCSLAALVIVVALSLINRRNIRICLKATRSDAGVLLFTFLATLLTPLHVAIFLGVGASIVLYLKQASRPHLVEYSFNESGQLTEAEEKNKRDHPSISIVHVEGELFFGAAELFRTQIQRTCADPSLRVIVLRMRNARHLDATSVMALEELVRFLRDHQRYLIISGMTKDVYRVLKNAEMIPVIGRENIFLNAPSNPNLSTRNALKRAQEILGTTNAEVKIYYDPNQDSGI